MAGVAVLAATACSKSGNEPVPAATAKAVETPAPTQALSSEYRVKMDQLSSGTVEESVKLALLEELAGDQSPEATEVLLAGALNPSAIVASTSVMGLRHRPCERIQATLIELLDHGDWRCRTWAAKVLGENGCTGAIDELEGALSREQDGNVQAAIETALDLLKENGE